MLYSGPKKKPGVEAFRGLLRGAINVFHEVAFREDQKMEAGATGRLRHVMVLDLRL